MSRSEKISLRDAAIFDAYWDDVTSRIGELLEEGQFAANVELAEMRSFE